MSRDLPDDVAGRKPREVDYAPGEDAKVDVQLVDRSLRLLSTVQIHYVSDTLIPEDVRDEILDRDDLDGQSFIERVIHRTALHGDKNRDGVDLLVSQLLGIFHQKGQNDFEVDYRGSGLDPNNFSCYLRGTQDEPLKATIYADDHTSGFSRRIGFGSVFAEINFDPDVLPNDFVGSKMYHSTLHVPNANDKPMRGSRDSILYVHGDWDEEWTPPVQEYEQSETAAGYFWIETENFWERRNTLYIPDGDGGWQEVRPDEP